MAVERLGKILDDFLTGTPIDHPDYNYLVNLKEGNASYAESPRRGIRLNAYENKIIDIQTMEERKITEDSILPVVAETFGISVEDILGKSRKREYVYPRFATTYLYRRLCDLGWSDIGKKQGGMDHSTISHHFARARDLKEKDPLFSESLSIAEYELGQLIVESRAIQNPSNGLPR